MSRKLLNSELERLTVDQFRESEKTGVVIVLDNIRSQHNIGSAFRTADAFRIEKIYLCGISATPPNAEIHKSALGAEFSVEWEYVKTPMEAISDLKAKGYVIVAVEQTEASVDLTDFNIESDRKYALIFGNEVKGVLQEAVDNSDYSIEIPQYGTKHSLNVSVAIGIVIWHIRRQFPQ